jgi:hypothetical protein
VQDLPAAYAESPRLRRPASPRLLDRKPASGDRNVANAVARRPAGRRRMQSSADTRLPGCGGRCRQDRRGCSTPEPVTPVPLPKASEPWSGSRNLVAALRSLQQSGVLASDDRNSVRESRSSRCRAWRVIEMHREQAPGATQLSFDSAQLRSAWGDREAQRGRARHPRRHRWR